LAAVITAATAANKYTNTSLPANDYLREALWLAPGQIELVESDLSGTEKKIQNLHLTPKTRREGGGTNLNVIWS
jgi:hypothetical protein